MVLEHPAKVSTVEIRFLGSNPSHSAKINKESNMSEKPAPNIPLVEEELDWETKCDLMRKAIVQLTRIKNLLDATPLDFKPDEDI